MERGHKPRQICRGLVHARKPLGCDALALQPGADGPVPGIACTGSPQGEWDGDRQPEVRREHGQPAVLTLRLPRGPVDAGQPDGQTVAKSENGVVSACMMETLDGQVRPLRELVCQQPPHQRYADLDLVLVHLRGHRHLYRTQTSNE